MHLTGDLMVDSEKFRKLLLCLAIVLSASVTGFGCWCRDPGPVLDRFENSKSVVVARVASVGETEATLVVDRVYKGKLRSGVALRFLKVCLRTVSEVLNRKRLEDGIYSIWESRRKTRSTKRQRAMARISWLQRSTIWRILIGWQK